MNENFVPPSPSQATPPTPNVPPVYTQNTGPADSLFTQAWHFFTNNFLNFLKIYWYSLLKFLKLGIIPIIILVVAAILYFTLQTDQNQIVASPLGIVAIIFMVLSILYLAVVSVYTTIWAECAMIVLVKDRSMNPTARAVFEHSRQYIRPFFWTSFLTGLLVILWGLLLIIPAIIFGVYYSLSSQVVIGENLKGMAAIKKSKEYVKGMWWKVFGYSLLLIMVCFILSILATVIDKSIGLYDSESGNGLFTNLLWIPLTPFTLTYVYLLYEKIKALKSFPQQ